MALPHLPGCSVDGCGNQARSGKHPLCEMHYGRLRRYGALEPGLCEYCEKPKGNEGSLYCSRICSLRMDRARRYGFTAEQALAYEAARQGCEICSRPFDPERLEPHWDHDHKTGELRGLLCRDCNWALGQFRDDPARLAAAITYLGDAR